MDVSFFYIKEAIKKPARNKTKQNQVYSWWCLADMVVLGWRLDFMILDVFSNP